MKNRGLENTFANLLTRRSGWMLHFVHKFSGAKKTTTNQEMCPAFSIITYCMKCSTAINSEQHSDQLAINSEQHQASNNKNV